MSKLFWAMVILEVLSTLGVCIGLYLIMTHLPEIAEYIGHAFRILSDAFQKGAK